MTQRINPQGPQAGRSEVTSVVDSVDVEEATELDRLWANMWDDLRHNATGRISGREIVAQHRPRIEAAVGLDVRRVKQAVTNIAVRHGVVKDPPPPDWSLMHLYGYSAAPADLDAEIAAEYASHRAVR